MGAAAAADALGAGMHVCVRATSHLGNVGRRVQDGGVVEARHAEEGPAVQCVAQAAAVAELEHQLDLRRVAQYMRSACAHA